MNYHDTLEGYRREFNRNFQKDNKAIFYPFKKQGNMFEAVRVLIKDKAFYDKSNKLMVRVQNWDEPVRMDFINFPKTEDFNYNEFDKKWSREEKHLW